jgi:hypothetical protein
VAKTTIPERSQIDFDEFLHNERRQLMRAHTLLYSLVTNLEEHQNEGRVNFADLAEIARDLVQQVLDQLDSTNLPKLIAAATPTKKRSRKRHK